MRLHASTAIGPLQKTSCEGWFINFDMIAVSGAPRTLEINDYSIYFKLYKHNITTAVRVMFIFLFHFPKKCKEIGKCDLIPVD